jgi:hypothetical protein
MGIDNDEARPAGYNFPREDKRADADNDASRLKSAQAAMQQVRDILFGPTARPSWPEVVAELRRLKGNDTPAAPAAATDGVRAYVKPTILYRPRP